MRGGSFGTGEPESQAFPKAKYQLMQAAMKRILYIGLMALMGALLMAGCKDNPDVIAKVEAARARNDGPPIWKVTDPNSNLGELYILGAVHILPQDLDWQKDDLNAIFTKSGTVFFEVASDKAAQERAAIITARDGYYSGGKTLPDILDGYNARRLVAATLNAGLPDGALDRFQPWLAADVLALSALEKAGMHGKYGADKVLADRAKARGKYTRYLETMDEHLDASAILPEALQKSELITTFDTLGDLPAQTRLMNTAWASGNAAYIDTEILAPLRVKAPEYYDALFTRRNEKWAPILQQFVKDGDSGLAVVGVGHMLGEGSLVEQLERRGLNVTRYRAFTGNNVIKTVPLDMKRREPLE